MNTNDRELLDEFIRVERTESGVRIEVQKVNWDGPYTPISTWVVDQNLPANATDAEVNAAAAHLLDDSRYFGVCGECEQRNPVGWMHEERLCQSCASFNHGVVY